MKKTVCGLLILSYIIFSFAEETYRQGVHFGIGFSPSFSYLLISSKTYDSQAWYSDYLGGFSVEARLGYSKSEYKASSFISSLTWDYPSTHFTFSLFNGYAFTFYTNEAAPSTAFEFFGGLYSSHVAGLDKINAAWGLKTGFKTGYEFKKRLTLWIGHSIACQLRSYSYPATLIDVHNDILHDGTSSSAELIFPTSVFASLTYLF